MAANARREMRRLTLDPGTAPELDPDREPEGFVVEVGAERIHFLDWGPPASASASASDVAEAPGVLLIHGIGQTAWTWAPVARRLASRFHVVALDLRGHGLSDSPAEGYEPRVLVEDVTAVVEGTGLDGAGGLVLAGHGFGASLAAWVAVALPDIVRGLVLVDGGWEDVAASSGMTPEEWLPGLAEPPEVMRSLRAYLGDRYDFDPWTWDTDQDRAARATVVEVPAGHVVPATRAHALAGTVRAMFAYHPATLIEVPAPVVALVAGDADGTRLEALEAVADERERAGGSAIGVATFPDAGHNLMRYRPAEVAAAITEVAGTIGR